MMWRVALCGLWMVTYGAFGAACVSNPTPHPGQAESTGGGSGGSPGAVVDRAGGAPSLPDETGSQSEGGMDSAVTEDAASPDEGDVGMQDVGPQASDVSSD